MIDTQASLVAMVDTQASLVAMVDTQAAAMVDTQASLALHLCNTQMDPPLPPHVVIDKAHLGASWCSVFLVVTANWCTRNTVIDANK